MQCFGPILFLLKNKLIGYADDSTLMAVVPSPGVTFTMIVSRLRIMLPQSPPLTIGGNVLKESGEHDILAGTLF